MTSTTQEARESLAEAIAASTGWLVFAAPPDVVASPCVVVGPREPYVTRLTARQWELGLRLTLMVPAAAGSEAALAALEAAIDALRPDVLALPNVTWTQVGNVGPVSDGDVKYIAATIDCKLAYTAPTGG